MNHGTGQRSKWLIWLAGGLLVEVCCLGVVLLIWMAGRGLPPTAIFNSKDISPVAQSRATNTSISFALPASPTSGFTLPTSYPALQPPTMTSLPVLPSRAPTATPSLPDFDVQPPGKIVYACFDGEYDQICIMNADGMDKRQLTFDNATSFYPSLSPDGEQIVFSSRRSGNFEIYMMDVDGSNLEQMTDHIGNLYAPEISPKGNRIIFTAETGGVQSIWVMKIDGGNPHPLFEGSGSDIDPTWSPDANQVAFASSISGDTELYVANLQGDRVYAVQKGVTIGGRSTWSPDGEWLAFYAGPRGDRNIFRVTPNGGGLQQLTAGGDNLGPSFSPDGRWLAFTSYRDGNNEVYVMWLATLQIYRLTFSPNSDWQPRWGP